jgi:hypothetical protein
LPYRERAGLVDEVCKRRSEALKLCGGTGSGPYWSGPGKLLLYDPDWNLFDGAAEQITGGYFDVNNVPPWDTWIAYVIDRPQNKAYDSYLISWIPPEHIELVGKGLWANPEKCISWAEDVDPRSLFGPLWREFWRNLLDPGQGPAWAGG